jgi:multiple sugar transport system permease protein
VIEARPEPAPRPETAEGSEARLLSVQRRLVTAAAILLLTLVSFLVIMPFLWTFSTSLRLPRDSFKLPPQWLPTDWRWQNYADVFDQTPFALYIFNSFKVTLLIVGGQIVTASLAAYAFARLRFPGKDLLFMLLMSAMMVPLFVTIIPIFFILSRFKLVDTHAALIVPALTTAFGVFLLRQFFLTIPVELEEAARIDGASPFQSFLRVILPLGAPGISVLAILSFNSHWNEFFRPLVFLSTGELFTVPLGLVALRGYMGTGSVSVVLAGVVIALIPVVLVFVLAQRYLIEGIAMTGIKG